MGDCNAVIVYCAVAHSRRMHRGGGEHIHNVQVLEPTGSVNIFSPPVYALCPDTNKGQKTGL